MKTQHDAPKSLSADEFARWATMLRDEGFSVPDPETITAMAAGGDIIGGARGNSQRAAIVAGWLKSEPRNPKEVRPEDRPQYNPQLERPALMVTDRGSPRDDQPSLRIVKRQLQK